MNLNHGLLLPQAVDLEQAVLGATMLEAHVYGEISDLISQKVFYKEQHRMIWAAIEQLHSEKKLVDILTITDQLRRNGQLEQVGGAYYVTELTNRVVTVAHIRQHSQIIYEQYIGRELIAKSDNLQKQAYSQATDKMQLAEQAIVDFTNITLDIPTSNLSTDEEVIAEEQKYIDDVFNKLVPAGLKTGIRDIDRQLGGLRNGELIIIAARPSMGKTSLMVQIAVNLQIQNYPCAIYSYEMSKGQLVHKILANACQVDSECITNGNLNRADYDKLKAYKRPDTKLYISDKPVTVDNLYNQCLKLRGDIRCLLVDYLQLITVNPDIIKLYGMNREQQVSYMSNKLKQIAKECNIPVVALAQLSRAAAQDGKMPELHHLRESGAIEQDADVVMFPHRPEYYGMTQDEEGNSTEGVAYIGCKKNRNGKVFLAKCQFINKYSMFKDFDEPF